MHFVMNTLQGVTNRTVSDSTDTSNTVILSEARLHEVKSGAAEGSLQFTSASRLLRSFALLTMTRLFWPRQRSANPGQLFPTQHVYHAVAADAALQHYRAAWILFDSAHTDRVF